VGYTSDFFEFIDKNLKGDTAKLKLLYGRKSLSFDIDDAITQIEARKNASKKLPDFCSSDLTIFPHKLSAEQATSEILAGFHASLIPEGMHILDLTAGLGIDSMAFARTGKIVTAVERDSHTADTLKYNIDVLNIPNLTVICRDAETFTANTDSFFDTIFIDPARRGKGGRRTFSFSDCSPDIIPMLPGLMRISSGIIIKASPMLDITDTLQHIPNIKSIYALSLRGECKELLIRIDTRSREESGETEGVAINFSADGTPDSFAFCLTEDIHDAKYIPKLESGMMTWLYEPNASLMKFAPWRPIQEAFPDLLKLHPNTHLFVSNEYRNDFPGRIFRIEEVGKFKSAFVKELQGKGLCVSTRNFPLSPEALAKRVKARNGNGDLFLIGATATSSDHILIKCRREK